MLLKTVSDRVFTLPPPEIKPEKILAQYEINEIMLEERNKPKLGGTIKKYTSIKDVKNPTYVRVDEKPEVEIHPDEKGKVKLEQKHKQQLDFNPYEYQINRRIKPEKDDEGKDYPKMGWEARAFFEQSQNISKQDPTWENEEKNPIMYYIPSRQLPEGVYLPEQAFVSPEVYPTTGAAHRTNDSFSMPDIDKSRQRNKNTIPGHRSKKSEKSMPSTPYEVEEQSIRTFSRNPTKSIERTTNGDEGGNTNMLYGPKGGLRTFTKSQLALTEFKKTQLQKGTQRSEIAGLQNPEPTVKQYGFRTRFILNDLFTDKVKTAREARNRLKEDKKEEFIADEYKAPKDPVFRDDDLPFGKQEMKLLYKCPKAVNPNNMSEMNTKPVMVQDKELKELETMMSMRQEEYEKALQSDKPRPKELTWTKYHHVPEKLKPISTGLKDEYKPKKVKKVEDPFLPKDNYGYDKIYRPVKQEYVIGKDNMKLYFKPLKARDDDIDQEFGRVTKKYKTIY